MNTSFFKGVGAQELQGTWQYYCSQTVGSFSQYLSMTLTTLTCPQGVRYISSQVLIVIKNDYNIDCEQIFLTSCENSFLTFSSRNEGLQCEVFNISKTEVTNISKKPFSAKGNIIKTIKEQPTKSIT